jgi:hypothetical protein
LSSHWPSVRPDGDRVVDGHLHYPSDTQKNTSTNLDVGYLWASLRNEHSQGEKIHLHE